MKPAPPVINTHFGIYSFDSDIKMIDRQVLKKQNGDNFCDYHGNGQFTHYCMAGGAKFTKMNRPIRISIVFLSIVINIRAL
jgi:hypothetical protein